MDSYEIYLLEYLAYRISPGNKEFDQWREDFKEQYGTATEAEVSKEAVESLSPEGRRRVHEFWDKTESSLAKLDGKINAAVKSKK